MSPSKERFSPIKHVPHYTRHLFGTLQTPLLIYFSLIGNLILFSIISIFYLVEKNVNTEINSVFDAFWWGFVTVTTVGYGEIVPVTTEGRVLAIILMITGVIFFVSFTALLVSFLLARIEEKSDEFVISEIHKLRDEIKELKALLNK